MNFTQVVATIDYTDSGSVDEAVQTFASDLIAGGALVELDLTIIPPDDGSGHSIVSHTPGEGDQPEPVDYTDWRRLDSSSFGFSFPNYHHLLLEILHGPPGVAPYSTAACVYNSNQPSHGAFVIRGFYAASVVDIPTANDVQLRPVAPHT
jgi:hypothetical protein